MRFEFQNPTRLSELGIGDALLARYAEDTLRLTHDAEGRLPGRPAMDAADIVGMLEAAL